MLIVGEKEQADCTVAVRPQGGAEQCVMTMEDFAKKINDECREMTKEF
jgi:threonyl-tRNA synthetase